MKPTTYNLQPTTKLKGFSFIEVMLSVFLLSVGMVAAISLIGAGLKESIDSRNQLIASLLTQEGVELVRNIRDNNQAQSVDAFIGINDGTWKIDVILSTLIAVGGSPALNYDSSNLRYAHSGGSATRFSREIFVSTGSTADEKIVTSMVIWRGIIFPSVAGCTTSAGCSYATATLTR